MKIDVEKINWLRIEKGLSLTTLGKDSELSKSTMTRLFQNKTNPRMDTVGRIAKVLGVSVKELIVQEEE